MAKTAAKDLNNLQVVYIPSTVKDGHSRKVGLWSRAGYERYRFAARYHHAKIGPQCTGIGRQFISKTLPTLTRISLAFSWASWRMKFTICRIWSVAAMVKFLQRFFTIKKEKKKDISAAICRCQRQSSTTIFPSPCCGDGNRYTQDAGSEKSYEKHLELVFHDTIFPTVKSTWNRIITEVYPLLAAIQNYWYVKCNVASLPEIGERSSYQTNTGLAWTLAFV